MIKKIFCSKVLILSLCMLITGFLIGFGYSVTAVKYSKPGTIKASNQIVRDVSRDKPVQAKNQNDTNQTEDEAVSDN